MKPLSLLLPLFILPLLLWGTSQEPDLLLINGQQYNLFSTPLYSYFNENNPPSKFFKEEGVDSTGNWRGYVATWEIKENKLYLTGIEKEYQLSADDDEEWLTEMRPITADRIIPGKAYPVFAFWYSGVLEVPEGDVINYVHMGFETVFEKTILYAIKDGLVTKHAMVENTGPNLYRSQWDLIQCALADHPMDASGAWIDARLLKTAGVNDLIENGESFKTRGIYFSPKNASDIRTRFWVPHTPRSEAVYLYIYLPDRNPTIPNASPVEIEGHFNPNETQRSIIVEHMRVLEPEETIHDPLYPEIADELAKLTETYNENATKLVRRSVEKPASKPR